MDANTDDKRGQSDDFSPARLLEQFAEVYSAIASSPAPPASKVEAAARLIGDFLAEFVVMPFKDYEEELDMQGEWQSRARRVINAANEIADRPEESHLRSILVKTDFREEER